MGYDDSPPPSETGDSTGKGNNGVGSCQSPSSSSARQSDSATFVASQATADFTSYAKKVLLVGPTAAGKSSLANWLVGDSFFRVGHGAESMTQSTSGRVVAHNGVTLDIVDTPGFDDSSGGDEVISREFARFIDLHQKIGAVLVVRSARDVRLSGQAQSIYRNICQVFGDHIRTNVAVVYTGWGHSAKEVRNRVSQNMTTNSYVEDQKTAMRARGIQLADAAKWVFTDTMFDRDNTTEVDESSKARTELLDWCSGVSEFDTPSGLKTQNVLTQKMGEIQRTREGVKTLARALHEATMADLGRKLNLTREPFKPTHAARRGSRVQYSVRFKRQPKSSGVKLYLGFEPLLNIESATGLQSTASVLQRIENTSALLYASHPRSLSDVAPISQALVQNELFALGMQMKRGTIEQGLMNTPTIVDILVLQVHDDAVAAAIIAQVMNINLEEQTREEANIIQRMRNPRMRAVLSRMHLDPNTISG